MLHQAVGTTDAGLHGEFVDDEIDGGQPAAIAAAAGGFARRLQGFVGGVLLAELVMHQRQSDQAFDLLGPGRTVVFRHACEAARGRGVAVAQQRLPAGIAARHHTQLVIRMADQALRQAKALLRFFVALEQQRCIGHRQHAGIVVGLAALGRVVVDELIRAVEVSGENRICVFGQALASGEAGGQGEVDVSQHGNAPEASSRTSPRHAGRINQTAWSYRRKTPEK